MKKKIITLTLCWLTFAISSQVSAQCYPVGPLIPFLNEPPKHPLILTMRQNTQDGAGNVYGTRIRCDSGGNRLVWSRIGRNPFQSDVTELINQMRPYTGPPPTIGIWVGVQELGSPTSIGNALYNFAGPAFGRGIFSQPPPADTVLNAGTYEILYRAVYMLESAVLPTKVLDISNWTELVTIGGIGSTFSIDFLAYVPPELCQPTYEVAITPSTTINFSGSIDEMNAGAVKKERVTVTAKRKDDLVCDPVEIKPYLTLENPVGAPVMQTSGNIARLNNGTQLSTFFNTGASIASGFLPLNFGVEKELETIGGNNPNFNNNTLEVRWQKAPGATVTAGAWGDVTMKIVVNFR